MLRASETEATTDALTGLGNRRALLHHLARAADDAGTARVTVLALFDLDGFKSYNDAFGHPVGDALLERLGGRLADALAETGHAYRMGGDEFCVLARVERDAVESVALTAAAALSEYGERFAIGCSYGVVVLGQDARHPDEALRIADQRMYAHKRGGRPTREESIHNVLMSVVGEHDRALRDHVGDVAELAERVARHLGLDPGPRRPRAPRGRAARHRQGGDPRRDPPRAARARAAGVGVHAPAHDHRRADHRRGAGDAAVAEIVRSSHERWDGGGYPDGLAGEEIPLGSRIVAVCDSYDAMTTSRPYRGAMSVPTRSPSCAAARAPVRPPRRRGLRAVIDAGRPRGSPTWPAAARASSSR